MNNFISIKKEEQEKLSEEIRKFYNCELYQSETDILDKLFQIKLIHPYLNLTISQNHKGVKEIYCDFSNLKNVDYHFINKVRSTFLKPYNFSIISTKIIQDWVTYYENIYEEALKENNKNALIIQTFKNSIKDCIVNWEVENEVGEIIKNGLVYRFTINTNRISERILIDPNYNQNLELFLNLTK